MTERLRAAARRWLKLDGPGGLADVLSVKDCDAQLLEQRVQAIEQMLRQIVPVLNDHTTTLQRVAVYEQQVPSIRRVFMAMRERAVRERKRREAAAPPAPVDTPPQDALLDDVTAEVGGG